MHKVDATRKVQYRRDKCPQDYVDIDRWLLGRMSRWGTVTYSGGGEGVIGPWRWTIHFRWNHIFIFYQDNTKPHWHTLWTFVGQYRRLSSGAASHLFACDDQWIFLNSPLLGLFNAPCLKLPWRWTDIPGVGWWMPTPVREIQHGVGVNSTSCHQLISHKLLQTCYHSKGISIFCFKRWHN